MKPWKRLHLFGDRLNVYWHPDRRWSVGYAAVTIVSDFVPREVLGRSHEIYLGPMHVELYLPSSTPKKMIVWCWP